MIAQKSSLVFNVLSKIRRGILRELESITEAIMRNWPGRAGCIVRWIYYKFRFKYLGRKVTIKPGVRFFGHRNISIDDGSTIDFDCIIFAGPFRSEAERRYIQNNEFKLSDGEVKIGKGVHLSVGCYILGQGGVQIGDYSCCAAGTRILSLTNHYASFSDPSRRDVYFTINAGKDHECYMLGPIVLGRNVGVASHCILLPGATLSEDSFLAINSVARRGVIPPNCVAAGNPAVRMKERYKAKKDE